MIIDQISALGGFVSQHQIRNIPLAQALEKKNIGHGGADADIFLEGIGLPINSVQRWGGRTLHQKVYFRKRLPGMCDALPGPVGYKRGLPCEREDPQLLDPRQLVEQIGRVLSACIKDCGVVASIRRTGNGAQDRHDIFGIAVFFLCSAHRAEPMAVQLKAGNGIVICGAAYTVGGILQGGGRGAQKGAVGHDSLTEQLLKAGRTDILGDIPFSVQRGHQCGGTPVQPDAAMKQMRRLPKPVIYKSLPFQTPAGLQDRDHRNQLHSLGSNP